MAEICLSGGELDGLRLHYVTEGAGPATVLIHGLGGFAESWRRNIPELARYGTVIAVDLPGFGGSSKPRCAYRLPFLVQSVAGVLRGLRVERARLVGHSLGGAVAAGYALTHPERVDRLALIGAAVPGFPLRPPLVYRLMSLPGVGELASRLITRSICTVALERCFANPDRDEVDFLVGHQYAARSSAEGRAAYLSMLRCVQADFTAGAGEYRRALAELDRPALVIHGRQDRVVPLSHAEAVVGGFQMVESRWLDRCGHFPQIEHAAAVNEWLGDFLFARAAR